MSVQRFSVPVKSTYYNMRIREGYDQYGNHDILSLSLNPINMNSESSYDAEGGLFERFSRKRGSSPRGKVSRKSKKYEIGLRDLTKYIPGYKKGDLDEEFYGFLDGKENPEFDKLITSTLKTDLLEQLNELSSFHKQFADDAKDIGSPEIINYIQELERNQEAIKTLIDKKQKTSFIAGVLRYQKGVGTGIPIFHILREYALKTNLVSHNKKIIVEFPGSILNWAQTQKPNTLLNILVLEESPVR